MWPKVFSSRKRRHARNRRAYERDKVFRNGPSLALLGCVPEITGRIAIRTRGAFPLPQGGGTRKEDDPRCRTLFGAACMPFASSDSELATAIRTEVRSPIERYVRSSPLSSGTVVRSKPPTLTYNVCSLIVLCNQFIRADDSATLHSGLRRFGDGCSVELFLSARDGRLYCSLTGRT